MTITTVIFAHGDAIDTVNRHLPTWKANTDNLLLVSPKDNPCVIQEIDCLTVEKRQHHGSYALKRQLFAMKAALIYNTDYYVFLEYDALMLKKPEPKTSVQGNLFNEKIFFQKQKENMEKGYCFLHFPWVFPANLLKEFTDKVVLDHTDEEAHDIWLIKKLMELNIDVHNLLCNDYNAQDVLIEGYSQNSFDTPERLSYAINCVKRGAYALHGIKTEDVFNKIIKAKEIYDTKPTKIFTYYDDINFQNQNELVDLWKQSWEQQGFDATVLTSECLTKCSFYNEFVSGVKYIHAAITGNELSKYGLSCYLRWLAYSMQNTTESFLVSDYDVINKNFNLHECSNLPSDRLYLMAGHCPCLAYGNAEQFLGFCKDIIDVSIKNKDKLKLQYIEKKNGCYHDQEFIVLNSERENYNMCHEFQKYVTLFVKDDKVISNSKTLHVAHRSVYETKEKFPELKEISSDVLRVQLVKDLLLNI